MAVSKLYVGNLNYATTKETLEKTFGQHGDVTGITMVTDRESGRFKGFGFVEMGSAEQAQTAKTALDGTELEGRTIRVDFAKQQEPRRPAGATDGGEPSGERTT